MAALWQAMLVALVAAGLLGSWLLINSLALHFLCKTVRMAVGEVPVNPQVLDDRAGIDRETPERRANGGLPSRDHRRELVGSSR